MAWSRSGIDGAAAGARLTVEAWALLVAARVALRVLRFGRVRATARRLARPGARTRPAEPEAVVAALATASRAVPRATCLVQALAGAVMLARHGHPASLRIGVAPDRPRELAHAWVESRGAVVLGDDGRDGYVPLPAIEVLGGG
jgi:hypothetical protein